MHLTGRYAPRFQAFFLAQASSVKMALSRPSRQQVTHTVRLQIFHIMSKSNQMQNQGKGSCSKFMMNLVLMAILIFGGALIGLGIARWVARGKGIAQYFGFFLIPISYTFAMLGWVGIASISSVLQILLDTFSYRSFLKALQNAQKTKTPQGKTALFLIPIVINLLGGVVIGIISPYPWYYVTIGYGALGIGYGALLYYLGRLGYLDAIFIGYFEEW